MIFKYEYGRDINVKMTFIVYLMIWAKVYIKIETENVFHHINLGLFYRWNIWKFISDINAL